MVIKFQAHNIYDHKSFHRASASGDHEIKERWIRVSPKKRGKVSSTPQSARANHDGLRISEPDPLMKHSQPSAQIIHPPSTDKGKAVLGEEVHSQEVLFVGEPILEAFGQFNKHYYTIYIS